MQGPGLAAQVSDPGREFIHLMKTQNFVLEWFRHQARLKADKARLLSVQLALQAREVLDKREKPAPASDRGFNLADQDLMLTQI